MNSDQDLEMETNGNKMCLGRNLLSFKADLFLEGEISKNVTRAQISRSVKDIHKAGSITKTNNQKKKQTIKTNKKNNTQTTTTNEQ